MFIEVSPVAKRLFTPSPGKRAKSVDRSSTADKTTDDNVSVASADNPSRKKGSVKSSGKKPVRLKKIDKSPHDRFCKLLFTCFLFLFFYQKFIIRKLFLQGVLWGINQIGWLTVKTGGRLHSVLTPCSESLN